MAYKLDPKLEKACRDYYGDVPEIGPCRLDTTSQRLVALLGGADWPHVDEPGNHYVCWPHHSKLSDHTWPEIWYVFLHEASHALKSTGEREATIDALRALPRGYRIATWRKIRQRLLDAGTLDIYLKDKKVFHILQ